MRPSGRASKTSSIATRIRFAAVFSNTISLMQNSTRISVRQTSLFGETASTFSREASPASRSARQANDEVRRTIAISGLRCCERFGKYVPAGSWAKMFSELLVGRKDWYSSRCALIWKLKVTASSRMYFQLAVSMQRTGDTEHGSSPILPTVQTQGLKICRNGRMEPLPLNLLPTPTASDGQGGIQKVAGRTVMRPSGQIFSVCLRDLAGNGLLPTPLASKIPDGDRADSPPDLRELPDRNALPTPKADDLHSGMQNRIEASCTQPLNETIAYRAGMTSRLNPLFVEEMMGFPNSWILQPFLRVSTSDSTDAAAM